MKLVWLWITIFILIFLGYCLAQVLSFLERKRNSEAHQERLQAARQKFADLQASLSGDEVGFLNLLGRRVVAVSNRQPQLPFYESEHLHSGSVYLYVDGYPLTDASNRILKAYANAGDVLVAYEFAGILPEFAVVSRGSLLPGYLEKKMADL